MRGAWHRGHGGVAINRGSMGHRGGENKQGGARGTRKGKVIGGAQGAREGGIDNGELRWRGAWHWDRSSGGGN